MENTKKFRIGYNEKHNHFEILVLVDVDKDLWMGGESFTREELAAIKVQAEEAGYEFCGYTVRAFAEVYA